MLLLDLLHGIYVIGMYDQMDDRGITWRGPINLCHILAIFTSF